MGVQNLARWLSKTCAGGWVSRFPARAWLGVAIAYIAIAAPFAAVADAPAEGQSVEAVWKPQQVSFEYRGYSTTYSCRSLEDKLKLILRTVGAREDVQL